MAFPYPYSEILFTRAQSVSSTFLQTIKHQRPQGVQSETVVTKDTALAEVSEGKSLHLPVFDIDRSLVLYSGDLLAQWAMTDEFPESISLNHPSSLRPAMYLFNLSNGKLRVHR